MWKGVGKLGHMTCERCNAELTRMATNQKYCYLCNADVGREKNKLSRQRRKDALKNKEA
jgi:hypothetical protein